MKAADKPAFRAKHEAELVIYEAAKSTLAEVFQGVSVSCEDCGHTQDERDAVEAFITAKRIEGCSERTLRYYWKTIESMLSAIGKKASQVTTEDLRKYLTTYQTQRKSSKVTIDNKAAKATTQIITDNIEPAAATSPVEYMIERNGSEVNYTPEYALTIKSS